MTQPVAQGDAFSGKIYIDAGDDLGREAHTAEVVVKATDTFGTVDGTATISWENLVGVSAAAGSTGVTFTPI